ncbi:hypothetical protein [Carboxydothermus pertinax]|uniref:Xanthine permease n=1 Tax=Carboxydothermus pertinax TaxID=870242 RepID=A0A1L8CSG6_9THEO|nr:hypothetical protein [Carboxydothermus pertinax]GAV21837.1 xanthine permease [Carboxydothermus pertinax]
MILVVLGTLPKFAALATIIPAPVLGELLIKKNPFSNTFAFSSKEQLLIVLHNNRNANLYMSQCKLLNNR